MAPTTQRTFAVPAVGVDWKLYTEQPVPAPGPNEILVKVVAAGINPVDAYCQKVPLPFVTEFPHIGGYDGAGVVEELGPGVATFSKGDKIVFPGVSGKKATFQEYAIVALEDAALVPDNVSLEEAASIPLTLTTVVTGLWAHHPAAQSLDHPAPWEEGGKTKFVGQPALIMGGGSSVGQFAIQMARIQGYSPIITTSAPKHEAYLKSIGATHVLDRSLSHDQILEQLPKLTGGKPILYAYDAIGRDETTQHVAYDALAPGGGLVVTHPQSQAILAEREKRDNGSIKVVRPFGSFAIPPNKKLGEGVYAHLTEWLKNGDLIPNRIEVIPGGLPGIVEACNRHITGNVSGVKLVVRVTDTP